MNITHRTVANQIITTFQTTGTKVPKRLSGAHARASRLDNAARSLGASDAGALGVAVTAALDDGRDPAADPEVQRLLAARAMASDHSLADQVTGAAHEQVREVCHEHADAIVQAWAEPFDRAAATLTAARSRIGAVPLDDSATILRLGDDIADTWAAAQRAVATIDTIAAGWSALGSFTRLVQPTNRHRMLRIAEVDYDQWIEHRLADAKADPWTAMLAGLTLSLPSFAEYKRRVGAIEQAQREPVTVIDTERSSVAGREIRVSAPR